MSLSSLPTTLGIGDGQRAHRDVVASSCSLTLETPRTLICNCFCCVVRRWHTKWKLNCATEQLAILMGFAYSLNSSCRRFGNYCLVTRTTQHCPERRHDLSHKLLFEFSKLIDNHIFLDCLSVTPGGSAMQGCVQLGNWIQIFHGEVRGHSPAVIFLLFCKGME